MALSHYFKAGSCHDEGEDEMKSARAILEFVANVVIASKPLICALPLHLSSLRYTPCLLAISGVAMASRRLMARLTRHTNPESIFTIRCSVRSFSSSPQRPTDGVFRELTTQRTSMPWIEALRKQQTGTHDPSQPTPKDRDLSPKKMSDSHYSVVRFQSM